jgi:hypothetical protein
MMKVIEKIRAMSADEIAEFLDKQTELPKAFYNFCESRAHEDENGELVCVNEKGGCKGCIRDWLESEVQEQ